MAVFTEVPQAEAAEHLRQFDRFTAADAALRARRLTLHTGEAPPLVARYVSEPLSR